MGMWICPDISIKVFATGYRRVQRQSWPGEIYMGHQACGSWKEALLFRGGSLSTQCPVLPDSGRTRVRPCDGTKPLRELGQDCNSRSYLCLSISSI